MAYRYVLAFRPFRAPRSTSSYVSRSKMRRNFAKRRRYAFPRANIRANGHGGRLRGKETIKYHRRISFRIIVTARIIPLRNANSRFAVAPLSFALCFRLRTKQAPEAYP